MTKSITMTAEQTRVYDEATGGQTPEWASLRSELRRQATRLASETDCAVEILTADGVVYDIIPRPEVQS